MVDGDPIASARAVLSIRGSEPAYVYGKETLRVLVALYDLAVAQAASTPDPAPETAPAPKRRRSRKAG